MTRRVHPGSQLVYEASERFVDVALRKDDSLFTRGSAIWSAGVSRIAPENWVFVKDFIQLPSAQE